MLKEHGSNSIDRIIFSCQKLFCSKQCYNSKGDVVYWARFKDIPKNISTVKSFQDKKSIIVCVAVSKNLKLSLKFIDKGVNHISDYCKKNTMTTDLLLNDDRFFTENNWTFHEDSEPSERAK